MKKNVIITRIILVLLLFVGFNLVKVIIQTYSASSRTNLLTEEVQSLSKEYNGLLAERDYRQTNEFIEKEARNRLQLVKPGETVFVIKDAQNVEEKTLGQSPDIPQGPIFEQWKQVIGSGLHW